jgi:hypothetical protein
MWTSNSTLGVHIINPWPQDLPYTKKKIIEMLKKIKIYLTKIWIIF